MARREYVRPPTWEEIDRMRSENRQLRTDLSKVRAVLDSVWRTAKGELERLHNGTR